MEYPPCIATYSGKMVNLLNPEPADVCIEDIAHSLSLINRYTGHTKRPYSVATHSILAMEHWRDVDALAALLHDSAEAYIGDVSSPFKQILAVKGTGEALKRLEERHLAVIGDALDINNFVPRVRATKLMDKIMLVAEVKALLPYPDDPGWAPWVSRLNEEESLLVEKIVQEIEEGDSSIRETKERFLDLYWELEEEDY